MLPTGKHTEANLKPAKQLQNQGSDDMKYKTNTVQHTSIPIVVDN